MHSENDPAAQATVRTSARTVTGTEQKAGLQRKAGRPPAHGMKRWCKKFCSKKACEFNNSYLRVPFVTAKCLLFKPHKAHYNQAIKRERPLKAKTNHHSGGTYHEKSR